MPDDEELHNHAGAFAGMHSHDGGAAHWHDEFGAHTAEDLTPEEFAARQLDWRMHNVQIVTVGMDIGSSTSHLMFSKISMQLVGEGRDVRSVVVGREILAQSPIVLTPYLPDDSIDTEALHRLIFKAYLDANATSEDVDSGAIILTGEALKRQNARQIAELFTEYGKFVCASAGHHLEAVLAANGSGTVSRSRRDRQTLLNVDIGGGTTKLAIVRDGEVVATAAVAIGARLIAMDESRRVRRIDGPAQQIADHLGIELTMGERLSVYDEATIVEAWTDILTGLIERRPVTGIAAELMLTEPLPADVPAPQALTFSGGVSEFFFRRETRDFGDLGKPLADALRVAVANRTIRLPVVMDANAGIRATAVGASLFTTQVGFNLYISDESMLPLTNVPVLVPRLELKHAVTSAHVADAIRDALTRLDIEEGETPLALVLTWAGDLEPSDTRAIAEGIRDGLPRTIEQGTALVFIADGRLGAFARVLKEEIGVASEVLSFDGVAAHEFDFIDVAPLIQPTTVVPITIKSLLFAGGLDRRSVKQALYDAAVAQHRQDTPSS